MVTRLFSDRWAGVVGRSGREPDRDRHEDSDQAQTGPHPERQSTSAPGWLRLLDLTEGAPPDGREVFKPLVGLSPSAPRPVRRLQAPPSFPATPTDGGSERINYCGVCESPLDSAHVHRVWISLVVATDVLPLLVNACSAECIDALPAPPKGYVSPHHGARTLPSPGRATSR